MTVHSDRRLSEPYRRLYGTAPLAYVLSSAAFSEPTESGLSRGSVETIFINLFACAGLITRRAANISAKEA